MVAVPPFNIWRLVLAILHQVYKAFLLMLSPTGPRGIETNHLLLSAHCTSLSHHNTHFNIT